MSRIKSIVPQSIQQSKDIEEDEVLMIVRNMAGEELRIIVKKTAFFTDVRAYVAERADLKYCETRLMVNEEEPDGLTPIYSLPFLESRIIVELLVDTEQTEFDCLLCLQRRKISECREWNSQSELCCILCEGRPHMCCWLDVEEMQE